MTEQDKQGLANAMASLQETCLRVAKTLAATSASLSALDNDQEARDIDARIMRAFSSVMNAHTTLGYLIRQLRG